MASIAEHVKIGSKGSEPCSERPKTFVIQHWKERPISISEYH